MFTLPTLAASVAVQAATSKSLAMQKEAFERERRTFYITGGRPAPAPREPYRPAYQYQPAHRSSDPGISLGTLVMGGLLFGGF